MAVPQVRGAHALGGAHLPRDSDLSSNHRRCIVRPRYYSAAGGSAGHAKYLARPEAQEREAGAEKSVGYLGRGSAQEPFFDAHRNRIGREEVAHELGAGARRWHLVVNPLDGGNRDLDMRHLARDFMDKVQNDVEREIKWYGVVHKARRYDRDDAKHLHIAFSSKARCTRRDFRFARQYVKDGFRLRASEAIERQLGKMSPHEMQRFAEQLADNRERDAKLQQMDRDRVPVGKRIEAGRAWRREPSLRKERGAPPRQPDRPERAELRRLHRQQRSAQADARDLRAMGRELEQHAVQRVGFEEWLAAADAACKARGIELFPSGTPEHRLLNDARAELRTLREMQPAAVQARDRLAVQETREERREEIAKLRTELAAHFNRYRDLQRTEAALKAAVAARQNVISRWLHGRQVHKLEGIKTKLNDNRAERQKLRAGEATKATARKLEKLEREEQALRRQYGRTMQKIAGRMTATERAYAERIKTAKQDVSRQIDTTKTHLRHLRDVLRRPEPVRERVLERDRGMELSR